MSTLPTRKLATAAKHLLTFLDIVNSYPCLYLNKPILHKAIHRYEKLWPHVLALVPPSDRINLIPPIDVEWVWFCHMLCPLKYHPDSIAIWTIANPNLTPPSPDHPAIDHIIHSPKSRLANLHLSQQLWRSVAPDEPYDLHHVLSVAPTRDDSEQNADQEQTCITYDIVQAASRQMAFHYQVALPQYASRTFRLSAAYRYTDGFLFLQREHRGQVFVPTFDIDLVWHTHMAHPLQYFQDMHRTLGRLLNHDDTINDRSKGSEQQLCWNATKQIWYNTFGLSIGRHGAMWRGTVSADELVLRPKIAAIVKRVRNELGPKSASEGWNISNVVDVPSEFSSHSAHAQVPWVHTTVFRAATEHEAHTPETEIERWTSLGDHTRLHCRVVHAATRNEHGKENDICTAVEIFQTALQQTQDVATGTHTQGSSAATQPLPIATAHTPPLQSICRTRRRGMWNRKRCSLYPGERALVLRIAGVDFAVLAGEWVDCSSSGKVSIEDKVAVQEKHAFFNRRARPGRMRLRVWFLGGELRRREGWQQVTRRGGDETPGRYSVSLPDGEDVGVDLQIGTVEGPGLEAFLFGMSVAALFVLLQPRKEPTDAWRESTIESVYPHWAIAQRDYEMLKGAGGEVLDAR